jgi:hypothetical protein
MAVNNHSLPPYSPDINSNPEPAVQVTTVVFSAADRTTLHNLAIDVCAWPADGENTRSTVEALRGGRVLILARTDPDGLRRAGLALRALREGSSVQVSALTDPLPGGGVNDWIAAGGDPLALVRFITGRLPNALSREDLALEQQCEDAAGEDGADEFTGIPEDVLKGFDVEWDTADANGPAKFYVGKDALAMFLRPLDDRDGDPVPRILPPGNVMTITGRAGTGKTTMIIGAAVAKALGKPIFDAWECQPGTVIYAATEDMEGAVLRYSAALYRYQVAPEEAPVIFYPRLPRLVVSMGHGHTREGGKEFFKSIRVAQWRKELPEQLAVLILDYLSNAKGDAAENSNDDVGRALDAANRMARALKCGVILLAHPGKNTDDNTPRGAQVITDKSYCVATLKGSPDQKDPQVLEFLKNPKGTRKPLAIGLKMTELQPDLPYMEPVSTSEGSIRMQILKALRDAKAPLSHADLCLAMDVPEDKEPQVRNAMTGLHGDKLIKRTTPKKPYLYEITGGGVLLLGGKAAAE